MHLLQINKLFLVCTFQFRRERVTFHGTVLQTQIQHTHYSFHWIQPALAWCCATNNHHIQIQDLEDSYVGKLHFNENCPVLSRTIAKLEKNGA